MSDRKKRRDTQGILLLNKPINMTSNGALQTIKNLYFAKKAGHTGSLDPLATGMLPICFGNATKFSQFLLEADKTYTVKAQLGIRTASGDKDSKILSERPIPKIKPRTFEKILNQFRSEIEQTPPMYSALKHEGQPLYKLAREGIEIERKARPVTIYELELLALTNDTFDLKIRCSKGTYVRTLVDDIGELLECGAHVIELHRLSVGGFKEDDMVGFEKLQTLRDEKAFAAMDDYLIPMEAAVSHWEAVTLSENLVFYIKQGQAILAPNAPTSGWVRLHNKAGDFLGVGEIISDGRVEPRRLVK